MYIGKINNLKEKKMEANCNGNKIFKTHTKHVYIKTKVKYPHVFFEMTNDMTSITRLLTR